MHNTSVRVSQHRAKRSVDVGADSAVRVTCLILHLWQTLAFGPYKPGRVAIRSLSWSFLWFVISDLLDICGYL